MKILVTGSNGQLGTEMRNLRTAHARHQWFFTDVAELDITDREAVNAFVRMNGIDLIVNCAAYTNVDRAEEDEPTARLINAQAVENLALTGCRIIHISTDYVFSGCESVPCREDDPVAPATAYGRTKLEGERLLLAACQEAIIFRTAWLYSPYGNNFVKTMLRLGNERDELRVVYDQIGTPTYAADLARVIMAAIEAPEWHAGIYHFTNEGVCSWYDFTQMIARIAHHKDCDIRPCLSSEYPSPVKRPAYSVLDKRSIRETFGIEVPYWVDSLEKCISNIQKQQTNGSN